MVQTVSYDDESSKRVETQTRLLDEEYTYLGRVDRLVESDANDQLSCYFPEMIPSDEEVANWKERREKNKDLALAYILLFEEESIAETVDLLEKQNLFLNPDEEVSVSRERVNDKMKITVKKQREQHEYLISDGEMVNISYGRIKFLYGRDYQN